MTRLRRESRPEVMSQWQREAGLGRSDARRMVLHGRDFEGFALSADPLA